MTKLIYFLYFLLGFTIMTGVYTMYSHEIRITTLENDKCSTVEILVERSYDRETNTYKYEVINGLEEGEEY